MLSDPRAFLAERDATYRGWRHHLHQYPEVAFEERETAAFLREKLLALGLEIADGLATAGFVATLRGDLARSDRRAAHRHGCAANRGGRPARLPLAPPGHHARLRA